MKTCIQISKWGPCRHNVVLHYVKLSLYYSNSDFSVLLSGCNLDMALYCVFYLLPECCVNIAPIYSLSIKDGRPMADQERVY